MFSSRCFEANSKFSSHAHFENLKFRVSLFIRENRANKSVAARIQNRAYNRYGPTLAFYFIPFHTLTEIQSVLPRTIGFESQNR